MPTPLVQAVLVKCGGLSSSINSVCDRSSGTTAGGLCGEQGLRRVHYVALTNVFQHLQLLQLL